MQKIVVAIFIFLSINGWTQQQSFREIFKWSDDPLLSTPYFPDCYYFDSLTNIPFLFKSIEIPDNYTLPSISIEDISYSSCPRFNNLVKKKSPTRVSATYKIVRTKKKQQLQLWINAAIVQNGQYSTVNKFTVNIKYEKSRASNKFQNKLTKTESALKDGLWHKIKIKESGIYKITYEQLIEWGFQTPENISIYGFGGKQLSFRVNYNDPYSLPKVDVWFEKGNDGEFNNGDYLLFYGQGVINRDIHPKGKYIRAHEHDYTEWGHYMITSSKSPSKQIETKNNNNLTTDKEVNTFQDFQYENFKMTNLNMSGRRFFGEALTPNERVTYKFKFPNRVISKDVRIYTHVGAICSGSHSYIYHYLNGNLFDQVLVRASSHYDKGSDASNVKTLTDPEENLTLELKYISNNVTATGYIGEILVEATRRLIFDKGQMIFQSSENTNTSQNLKFIVNNLPDNGVIWNISNLNHPEKIVTQKQGNTHFFIAPSNESNLYIAFDGTNYLTPVYDGTVENQNIIEQKFYDMFIVTHSKFKAYAEELAEFHRKHDNLKVLVIEPQTIYNEFSSGNQDVSAIRNFLKMFYDRASNKQEMPKHLLLFGDGSYDNISTQDNTNYIPTFQTQFVSGQNSVACDDFFVILDEGEGGDEKDYSFIKGTLDMGVGRFPVGTTKEAEDITNKTITYIKEPNLGPWKNELIFIGDDPQNVDYYLQKDSYALATIIRNKYKWLNPKMILMDAYPQQTTSAGQRYPEVTQAINENIHRGVLLMNYTGHGSSTRLAHEAILDKNIIKSWTNDKWPFIMTGSCEVTRFDNKNEQSLGEALLLLKDAGAITLFSTTRVVSGGGNQGLSKNFYNVIFEPNEDGTYRTLGEVMSITKNRTGDKNMRNFTLFGNPALRLNIPPLRVKTDSVNGYTASEYTDTLKALKRITISGHITDTTTKVHSNYNGTIYPIIYDKIKYKETLNNDNNDNGTFKYAEYSSIIYKGKTSVTNGYYKFDFIVPIDINYEFGKGKISYYFEDGKTDAYGFFDNFYVGGSDTSNINDTQGPELRIYMNDTTFATGGTVNESPILIAHLKDKYGINTTGNVIGHDITATLNGNISKKIILNNFFENNLNSYQGGKIQYQFLDLNEGFNTLEVKAWDILNNSSTAYTEFFVANSADVALKHVLNYPNPFTTKTRFLFEHNQSSQIINVRIQIFTISGKLIKTLETIVNGTQYINNPIVWDGRDDFGDKIAKGIYIYKLRVSTADGKKGEKFEKLVILR